LKEKAQNSPSSKVALLELKHAVHSLTMLMLCSRKFYECKDKGKKKSYDSKPVKELIRRAEEAEKLADLESLLTDVFVKLAEANIFVRVSDDKGNLYFSKG